MSISKHTASPVAIGGLGGGGTRVFAFFLQANGYYIGSDLNEALDNLWYTLLFKRRSILLESSSRFEVLAHIFFSAMQQQEIPGLINTSLLESLVSEERLQETEFYLQDRMNSLLATHQPIDKNHIWGWKEPNTHSLIDKFLELNNQLKYIHVLRDPLYMAYSKNQNQFMNWGPVFWGVHKELNPRNSLTFWRKTHERIKSLKSLYPDRIMIVRYEDMINNTTLLSEQLASFLGFSLSTKNMNQVVDFINKNPNRNQNPEVDLSLFDPFDLDYIDLNWNHHS